MSKILESGKLEDVTTYVVAQSHQGVDRTGTMEQLFKLALDKDNFEKLTANLQLCVYISKPHFCSHFYVKACQSPNGRFSAES